MSGLLNIAQNLQPFDLGAGLARMDQIQQNALALMMRKREAEQQQAYDAALQQHGPGLGSADPAAYNAAVGGLFQSGPMGARLALPLIQQDRETAMIGGILGGAGAGGGNAPAPPPAFAPSPVGTASTEAEPVSDFARTTGPMPPAGTGGRTVNTPALRALSTELATQRRAVLDDTSLTAEQQQAQLAEIGNRWVREAPAAARSSTQALAIPASTGTLDGQAGRENSATLRAQATKLALIPNRGAQALSQQMLQRADQLDARDARREEARFSLQARREDADARRGERQEDMQVRRQERTEDRTMTVQQRREEQDIRRQERNEDRPTYGNGLEGRALAAVEELAPKIQDGSASPEEVRRYLSAASAVQQERIAPDGTRVTPRLPAYAPGVDQVVARYGANGTPPTPGQAPPQAGLPGAAGGVQEGTKTAPQAMQTSMLENASGVGKIDRALDAVNAAPGAVGFWAGAGNMVPGGTQDRFSPAPSVAARAAIADIGSLVLHDRSGAAVTASEYPRLRPFIPTVGDSLESVRTKLARFRQEYLAILKDQYDVYGPGQGFRANPVVERVLGANPATTQGQGGSASGGTTLADPLGIRGSNSR